MFVLKTLVLYTASRCYRQGLGRQDYRKVRYPPPYTYASLTILDCCLRLQKLIESLPKEAVMVSSPPT